VLQALEALERQVRRWPDLPKPERELESRPAADTAYHALAASLLLADGQRLREQAEDCRKLLVGVLYARRWLRPAPPGAPAFALAELGWLDALADWEPVPATALPARDGPPAS
jgi:hypothetical protein